LVIDGEVKDSYHEPGNIVFTPRGQLVFTVQDKRDSIVSIGGEVLGRFVAVSPPVVAPGTGDVFFWVRQNDRWCLYRNREPIDESESLVVDEQIGLRWDQEGRRVGYWVKRNGKWFVCVNGLATSALGLPLEFVGGPVFASDGGMAYSARVGDGAIAVVNGQRGELFDAVGQIVFSSDGKRFAHMAQCNSRQFVVLDGRSDTTFDVEYSAVYNQPGTMEDTPSFSPDGENLVYVVSNGGAQYVAVNDELRAGPYKYVSCAPAFAGDGKLIIFSAVLEPGYEMLIVGEEQIGPFQRTWWPKRQEFYSVRERPHLDSETGNSRFVGRDARTLALYEIAVGKH
jgi:hypothetical protein